MTFIQSGHSKTLHPPFGQNAENGGIEPILTDAARCPNDSNAQKAEFAKCSRLFKPGIPSNSSVYGYEQEADFTVALEQLVS